MKVTYIFRLIAIGCLVVMISAGCAKKIVNDDSSASIVVSFPYKSLVPGAVSAIEKFELIVEGRDFGSRIFPMVQEGSIVVGRADSIPVGRDRRIIARALDLQGVVLYRGERIINLAARGPVTVDLTLLPVKPMLNITPHYQELMMNQTFLVDVNVFNIPTLSGISFDFLINFSPCYIDTVMKGDQYGDTVGLYYVLGYDSVNVEVYHMNEVNPVVDAAGNAHLATISLPTYADWGTDTATVVMKVIPRWLYAEGSQFPPDQVYTDAAAAFLHMPIMSPTGSDTVRVP